MFKPKIKIFFIFVFVLVGFSCSGPEPDQAILTAEVPLHLEEHIEFANIEGGQRFDQPVSMIDVLPTILDFLELPMPEVMMGQSLAPLMLGIEGWEPSPVIFDQFWFDSDSKVLRGSIDVVDGRWGASLEINPRSPDEDEDEEAAKWRRPVPLLLYNLWDDYYCLNSIHKKRPDLVEKYTVFLETQWETHQALAQHFTRKDDVVLTPEQLETLRSLGYIR